MTTASWLRTGPALDRQDGSGLPPAAVPADDAAAPAPRPRAIARLLLGALLLVTAWAIGVSYYFTSANLQRLLQAEDRERSAVAARALAEALQFEAVAVEAEVRRLQALPALAQAAADGAAGAPLTTQLEAVRAEGHADAIALYDARGQRLADARSMAGAIRARWLPAAWPAAEVGAPAALRLEEGDDALVLRASAPLAGGGRVLAERVLEPGLLLRATGAHGLHASVNSGERVLLASAGSEPLPAAALAPALAAGRAGFVEIDAADAAVDAWLQPLTLAGRPLAVVVQIPEPDISAAAAIRRDQLLLVVLMTLAAALVLVVAMTRRLIRPIERLTARAEALSRRFAGRAAPRRGDEFDALVGAFDAMTEALLAHSGRLQRAHETELRNSLELQRHYALMRLLRGLAAAANESDSVDEALARSLREVGEYLDWPLGRALLLGDEAAGAADAPARSQRSLWFGPERERFADFIADSERRPLRRGPRGLVGRAWDSGLPHWVADLAALPEFGRRETAAACGLQSAVVIPVSARGHVTAFLEFFADRRVEASPEMLELVEAIGVELSRVAERHRNERDRRAGERELRRLAMVTAHTEKFVTITGTGGRIKWVNDAVVRAAGWSRAEFAGRYPHERLAGPGTDRAALNRMAQAILAGRPCREEMVFYSRSGEAQVHEVEGVPLLDEAGCYDEYALISSDVTAARRADAALRASEMYFRVLFDRSPMPASIQDADFRILRVNDALARLLGRSADDLVGCSPMEFTHPDDREAAQATRERILSEAQFDVERRLVAADGRLIWAQIHVAALRAEGSAPQYLAVIDDITRLKDNERALREARDAAEGASRAKSQFLANMSHEIRTPMNGVLGMTELLLGTPLSDKQRRFAEAVYRSGESLLAIINDILDFSKIEAGRLELDSVDFDLRTLVEDVFELLAPRAADRRLELAQRIEPAVPAVVRGDPVRLRQVLTNLVGNAIKFTEQGEVEVRVGCDPAPAAGAHCIRVEVRDTGIGIRPEALDQLFTSFTQVDQSMSRRYGGTGLGLAISKQLVELMGGRIEAESRVGAGSVFRFTVLLQAGDPQQLRAAPAAGSLRGRRVMVVEDNPTNRSILLAQLGQLGVECAAAEHGLAGLELLRAAARAGQHFDVVLVDAKMPQMDGLSMVEALRREPALARLGVILLTSLAAAGEARLAQASGVDIYLAKPVRQQELVNALAALLPGGDEAAARTAATLALGGMRVLLAEDNAVNQEVARAMLADLGCAVQVAANGRLALEALARARFDLVLMDCQMPEMDGFEALARLRDTGQCVQRFVTPPTVPVIALTANALAGDAERCLAAGFDGYLAKPVRQAQLAQALARFAPAAGGAAPAAAAPVAAAVPAAPAAGADEEIEPAQLDSTVIDGIRDMERRGAAQLLRRLVDAYVDSTPRLVADAERSLDAADAAVLRQAVHTLKSSSANLGAGALAQTCAEMESAARAGQVERARAQWPAAKREYRRVLAALDRLAREAH